MSGQSETVTHTWAPTQVTQGNNLVATAVTPCFGQYEASRALTSMQQNGGRLKQEIAAAMARFFASTISPFKRDMMREGWQLVRPVEGVGWRQWPVDPTAVGPVVPESWDPTRIPELFEEVSFVLEGDGGSISGLVMRQRALYKLGCLDGQFLAEWLLEHQQYIPESWRGHYLVFPGTVWRDRGGGLDVARLCWNGERWYLDFFWISRDDWNDNRRLLRRCDSSV